ncbi:hypothetical protein [Caldimonas tepidiphila]|uniref:hypothetical protein n=1 Tax=Caldimonas tepidiphila TaxID=2315841 RepID=UPI00147489E6|nr:hypothetical protein [Caldimonas tepidiphila]
MSPIDALLHLANLFALPLGTALIASLLAKLIGGAALGAVPLTRMLAWSATAAVLAVLGGLALEGRDGLMLTHGAMVLAIAVALGWLPRRN